MPPDTAPAKGPQASRIDRDDAAALQGWAAKFDVSAEQIREAVQAVGDQADDVEMHLKGSRSTSNSERTEAGAGQ